MRKVQLSVDFAFPDGSSDYEKELVARSMGTRAVSFTKAAVALQEWGGHPFVVRHQLCLGLELALKSALLRKDFDLYWPLLPKKKHFGHDLEKLAAAAAREYGLHPPRGEFASELSRLSAWYREHWLRYASGMEVLVSPEAFPFGRTLSRLLAILALLDREP